MPKPFIQQADVIKAIGNILEHYPLVDGPIRELLQNSDDAGATRQVWSWCPNLITSAHLHFEQILILDLRNHPTSFLVSPDYAQHQQVPSLIAINNAFFKEPDWHSLETIFASSKAQDATFVLNHSIFSFWSAHSFVIGSTVGQFGQGFRSVYHVLVSSISFEHVEFW